MNIKHYRLCVVIVFVLSGCIKAKNVGERADELILKIINRNDIEIGEDLSSVIFKGTLDNETKANCSPNSMDEFPAGPFNKQQLQNPFVLLLHILVGFYCFLLTAYVCNDYLLPALDVICCELNISADVAGATFLATASCFPELFVNVVGTFVTESDLGVGTVVGGAVFNTFATPAFGALSASQAIQLDSWILSRDCIIYIVSVSALVVVMWSGNVTLLGAVMLMVLFAVYFTLLFLNNSLMKASKWIHGNFSTDSKLECEADEETPLIFGQPGSDQESMPTGIYRPFVHEELSVEYRKSMQYVRGKDDETRKPNEEIVDKVEENVRPGTPFTLPAGGFFKKLQFFCTWPIKFMLFITIPDTRYKWLRFWYPLTFIMCIMWIALSSYIASWMTTVVGDILGISDSIMGITFLAAGGNMPELVSIVILSRKGNGDMAMSNTLGANTLDVLLCLGLPWVIKALMTGQDVVIESGAIVFSVLSIIVCVIGFFCVTAYYKFQLNKQVGYACLTMYAIFLSFSILLESNVFLSVNLPTCDDLKVGIIDKVITGVV